MLISSKKWTWTTDKEGIRIRIPFTNCLIWLLKHKQGNCSFFSLSVTITSFNTVFMALVMAHQYGLNLCTAAQRHCKISHKIALLHFLKANPTDWVWMAMVIKRSLHVQYVFPWLSWKVWKIQITRLFLLLGHKSRNKNVSKLSASFTWNNGVIGGILKK